MYLSVIIPSYNEKKNASSGVLQTVWEYLSSQSYSWEMILADDGSSDKTPQILDSFAASHENVRVLHLPHRGKGPTVIDALQQARGEWRLFTDFDQATPISEVEKLLPFTTKGYDIVIGSREVAGARRHKEPLHRHIMGRGFNLLVQLFAIAGIQDTQCGFKLFSQEAVEALCPHVAVYGGTTQRKDSFTGAFDVELLFMARLAKFLIAEVPVLWQHVKTDRVDPVKDSLRMLVDIFRIRVAALQGAYSRVSRKRAHG